MSIARILYWGLSYTTGIVCMTALVLRYLHERDKSTKLMIRFLLPFGLAIVSLSLMEGSADHPVFRAITGIAALVGASLVVSTFPAFALIHDEIEPRRRAARAFRALGWTLAAGNVASVFLPNLVRWIFQSLAMLSLGAAIFAGMSWISRARPSWEKRSHPAWMVALVVFFGIVLVVDLLRYVLPFLGFLGRGYLFFPGFYAFLNVFLLYQHLQVWAKSLGEDAAKSSVIHAERLEAYGISAREGEVLAHLARGRTYNEIADSLCVSLPTIKTHVSHLYEKTSTRNKVELLNLFRLEAQQPAQPALPAQPKV